MKSQFIFKLAFRKLSFIVLILFLNIFDMLRIVLIFFFPNFAKFDNEHIFKLVGFKSNAYQNN